MSSPHPIPLPPAGKGARAAPSPLYSGERVGVRGNAPWLPRWPGWAHLPRDARDVLFLLAVIGWTLAPHFAHLPAWVPALTAAVILWRAWLAVANAALPGRWPLIAVLLLATA